MACSALVGFLLSLTPLSCDLMGWRGAGGNGAADIGTNNLQTSIGARIANHETRRLLLLWWSPYDPRFSR